MSESYLPENRLLLAVDLFDSGPESNTTDKYFITLVVPPFPEKTESEAEDAAPALPSLSIWNVL